MRVNRQRRVTMNPYDEGQQSFRIGKLNNPYAVNSNNNRSWEYGFNTAYFSNLKKVKEHEQRTRKRGKKIQS